MDELTLQGELKRIFTGWMFVASPGLNAVEHPIYDVWLKDCKGENEEQPAVAEAPEGRRDARPPRAGHAALGLCPGRAAYSDPAQFRTSDRRRPDIAQAHRRSRSQRIGARHRRR